MAIQEFATMPLEDYKNAADAIREQLGTTDKIKSGDLADLINSIAGQGDGKIYYNTTTYWSRQTSFVPEVGAIVIYSDYATVDNKNIPAFKVGDGLAYVVDLPFSSDDLRVALNEHISDFNVHLTEKDREKLESSVTVSVERQEDESYNLILS